MSPLRGLLAARRPETSTGPGGAARLLLALLSFERPAAESPRLRPRRTLKTAQLAKQRNAAAQAAALKDHRCITRCFGIAVINDHRQDSKGTRWMPWHQESKKGVDGCDKPR